MSRKKEPGKDNSGKGGDIKTGLVYLSAKESAELMRLINKYLEQHDTLKTDSVAWEFALIAYNAETL